MYLILHITSITLSYISFSLASCAALLYLIQNNNLKNKHLGAAFLRLPNLSFLDELNYRTIGLGFPLLTIAIITGSLHAKETLGSYWNWGQKEIGSLVLWLFYALILHVRLSSKMRGKKIALLSLFAFLLMIFTLFAKC